MALTLQNFKTKYPQFADLQQPRYNLFLADVDAEVTTAIWGDKIDLGREMLLGHKLTLAEQTTASMGNVTGRTYSVSGEYSITENYSQGAAARSEYDSTWFGREYDRLRRALDTGMSIQVGP